jgi:transposase
MNPFQIAEEMCKLKREIKRLREGNEILLKASAFFASKQL